MFEAALEMGRWIGAALDRNKDAIDGLQGVATIIALLVGAVAGYRSFIRGRQGYPRCDMSLRATDHRLEGGSVLLHVRLRLKNHGEVMARLDTDAGFMWVQQVRPVIANVSPLQAPAGENKLVPKAEWPIIREAMWPRGRVDPQTGAVAPQACEIESGETETFDFDFVLKPDIKTVRLYTHCRNARKRWRVRLKDGCVTFKSDIGWRASMIYDITSTKEPAQGTPMSGLKERSDKQQSPEDRIVVIPTPRPSSPLRPDVLPQTSPEDRPPGGKPQRQEQADEEHEEGAGGI